MSEETDQPEAGRTAFDLQYRGQSGFEEAGDGGSVNLFATASRAPVGFKGRVKDPLRMREVLATLYEIVKSDFRYVPKDRTAYLAWRNNSQRGGVGASAFQAQKAYFDWLRENDPHAWLILDPVVTAHPDKLMFEVFSKDEGTYARVDVAWDALELDGEPRLGTTNVDYSKALYDGVQQMRSYRETFLAMSDEEFGVQTSGEGEVIEKHIEVPDSWLHGFLQVQSAATLGDIEFELGPMELYNMLRWLRLHADEKGKGRSIRAELTPGEQPRLVLEPWELVIECEGDVYRGQTAEVVRIWGRRRLMTLQRLLPYVTRVRVHLMGSGMPGFWIFECGDITVTMGLTGFVSSNWSQAVHLDTLLPSPLTGRGGVDSSHSDEDGVGSTAYDEVLGYLKKHWSGTVEAIAAATKQKPKDVTSALQRACHRGTAIYDLTDGVYRYRPLTDRPLDEDKLQFRNRREREGHELLEGNGGSVKLTSENEIAGRGVEFTATIDVTADQREYETTFQLTPDGRLYRPDCSCTFFRQHQLKEGPCPHLYALRMLVARKRLDEAENRGGAGISAETRTYVRRHDAGEDVYTLTLDHEQVRVQWGLRADHDRRFQRLMFNGIDDARAAYLGRIADLESKGFMDATE